MSSNANLDVARTLYESLVGRDFERAGGLLTEEVLALNMATGDIYTGREGFLQFARGWAGAFPDLRFGTPKISGGSDSVAVEYQLEGTHTGPLVTPRGHLPPTGMQVQVSFCDVLDFRDGRIEHLRSYFDAVSLLRQLGLLNGSPLHSRERRAPLELYAQPMDSGAPHRNKAVVHRHLQNVFNRHDPAAAADTCDRHIIWHGGSLGRARGLAAFQNVIDGLLIAFPDLEVQVLDTIAEGDRVVVRYTMSGTHYGEFQGIPPTCRRVVGDGTNTYRLEESRIAEEWWQGDLLGILQQIDATPAMLKQP
jgi:NTE family protein